MVDEARKRLVQEMVREKERAVEQARAEEREKYESRLSRKKNPFKKPKLKTPLQLLKEKIKGEKEVQDYRKLKAQRSRFGRATQSFVTGRERMLMYSNQLNKPLSFKNRLRLLKLRQMQQQVYQQQLAQQQANQRAYDYLFRAGDIAAPLLEKEISSFGGVSTDGDKMANIIGRESLFFSSNQDINHYANVSNEALMHAKAINFLPAFNLSNEVSFYSNMLP